MKYRIQVCLKKGTEKEHWADLRPSGGEPYEFETRREAEDAERLCYGRDLTLSRIVEVA